MSAIFSRMDAPPGEWQAFGAWLEDQLADPAVRADWYADALPRAVALALIRHRDASGWTQTELGRALGMTQAQVSRLECAEHVPSLDTLLRIADALGLAIDISVRPRADGRRPAPRARRGAIVETTDQLVIEVRSAA
ncbi:MAG: hypothetical protein RL190_1788 [Actinomycetota bacterium]